jgi:DegV family protein with EDD domain
MSIRIVTDSTCDLPAELIQKHNITVVPMYINVGSQEYRDGIDMTRQEFYEKLPEFKPAPMTAAPGPEVFRGVYESLAAEGATEILSIHISEKLSATVNVARRAAEETTRVPVTVFDARQLSMGTGFLAVTAAKAAAEGRTVSEILSLLEEQIARTYVFAALDTLEYLRRSGRMNGAVSALGKFLQVKPFLRMYNGNPVVEKVRTRKGAVQRLIDTLTELSPFEQVAVLYSGAADRAQAILQEVRRFLPDGKVIMEEITPTLGAHLGPGVLGFACIKK